MFINGNILLKVQNKDLQPSGIFRVPENISIIAGMAFEKNCEVREVFIPKNVVIIDKRAFYQCQNLEAVHFE